ncbi:MAG: YdcF family protein, partial [Bacteroidota bacterium]
MFFLLSKILYYFTTPLFWIFVCFLTCVVVKNTKWKKRMFWTGLILFFFFTNDFVANEFMSAWEVDAKAFKDVRPHELAIVLTGATQPILPDDRVHFQRGADRVIHTVQLYKLGLIKKILVSGGSGRIVDIKEREAVEFKKAMVLMGIPEGDIMIEAETRNTYESAIEVKKMLAQLNYKPSDCLLITSAFHMRRSLASYRKEGLELEPFSTDFYSHPRSFYPDGLLIPRVDALMMWTRLT